MNNSHIDTVRAFNRFYTSVLGILNKSSLNSGFSLPELRLMHELSYMETLTAKEITGKLNIDKGYLSRLILSLEKRKLLTKKTSNSDGRSFQLFLTKQGKKQYKLLNEASHNHIKEILSQLAEKDCEILVESMNRIREILSEHHLINKLK